MIPRIAVTLAVFLVATFLLVEPPSAAHAQEARVSAIEAIFNPSAPNGDCTKPRCTTTYTLLVASPANITPRITWSGANCAEFGQEPGRPHIFIWYHPHPPCPAGTHGEVTITATVDIGPQQFVCIYRGAETGLGPACTTTTVSTQGGVTTTTTPVVAERIDPTTTPPETRTLPLPGLGLGLVLVIGGGYFLYTRTRTQQTADQQWSQALGAEERAQKAILDSFGHIVARMSGAMTAYAAALDKYRTAYVHALSGSTEMQGMLAAWATAKQGAAKADLAFAILTLFWGLGSLGLKIGRWALSGRTAAAAGEAAVAGGEVAVAGGEAVAAGGTAVTAAERSAFVGRYLNTLVANRAAHLEALAAEAGVDLAQFLARHGDDAVLAGDELIKLVARQRGWHAIPAELENAVSRLLVNGRSALAGSAISPGIAAQDLALLQRYSARPGFWDWLRKAANWHDEIGWMGHMPEPHTYASLFYAADDIAFLQKVVQSGGNLARLGELVGPAQALVLGGFKASALGGTGMAAGAAGAANLAGLGADDMQQALGNLGDPLLSNDLSTFVDQFGVTDRFTAGQGYGRAVLGEMWELVTAPVTTIESHYFTFQAQDAYEAFLKNHGGDLQTMGAGLNGAISALRDLREALNLANPDDARNPLGNGKEQALRDALNDLQRVFDGADADWKRQHQAELDERRRHIEHKLGFVRTSLDAMRQMQARIDGMILGLESMQRDPVTGGLRSVTTLMSPEIGVRLISGGLYLNGMSTQLQQAAMTPVPQTASSTAAGTGAASSTPSPATGPGTSLFPDGPPLFPYLPDPFAPDPFPQTGGPATDFFNPPIGGTPFQSGPGADTLTPDGGAFPGGNVFPDLEPPFELPPPPTEAEVDLRWNQMMDEIGKRTAQFDAAEAAAQYWEPPDFSDLEAAEGQGPGR